MPRRSDENEDREEEDPVAIRDVSDEEDEDEANEDLTLKILEKALSRRELDDPKETTLSDPSGSGVVSTAMVNGRDSSKSHKKKTKTKKTTSLEEEDALETVSMNDSLPFVSSHYNVACFKSAVLLLSTCNKESLILCV